MAGTGLDGRWQLGSLSTPPTRTFQYRIPLLNGRYWSTEQVRLCGCFDTCSGCAESSRWRNASPVRACLQISLSQPSHPKPPTQYVKGTCTASSRSGAGPWRDPSMPASSAGCPGKGSSQAQRRAPATAPSTVPCNAWQFFRLAVELGCRSHGDRRMPHVPRR